MKQYQPITHRTPFAIAAIALTAITIAVMVIIPTKMDGVDRTTLLAKAPAAGNAAPVEVATRFGRIDVVATRTREVALQQVTNASKL